MHSALEKIISTNPYVIAGAVVGGVTTVVALPVVASVIGFGGAGVVAGSIAAGAQASIGNVVAGSTFAALQSAGVLGFAVSTKLAVGAAGAAATGAISGATAAGWRYIRG